MEFKFATTDDEDAAIVALSAPALPGQTKPQETVEEFLTRAVRHQVNFAVSRFVEAKAADTSALLAKTTPEDKAAIDAILEKYREARAEPPLRVE